MPLPNEDPSSAGIGSGMCCSLLFYYCIRETCVTPQLANRCIDAKTPRHFTLCAGVFFAVDDVTVVPIVEREIAIHDALSCPHVAGWLSARALTSTIRHILASLIRCGLYAEASPRRRRRRGGSGGGDALRRGLPRARERPVAFGRLHGRAAGARVDADAHTPTVRRRLLTRHSSGRPLVDRVPPPHPRTLA